MIFLFQFERFSLAPDCWFSACISDLFWCHVQVCGFIVLLQQSTHPSIHPSFRLPLIQGWLGVSQAFLSSATLPSSSWGSLRPEETYIIPPASSGFGRGPDILQTEVPRRYPNQMLKLPQLAPFFRCEGTAALLPAPSECRSSLSYLQARVTEAAGLLVSKFSFFRSLPTAHDCRWGSEQISTGKLKASLLTQDRQLLSNIQGIVLKFLT